MGLTDHRLHRLGQGQQAAVVAVRRHGRPPHPAEKPRPLAEVSLVVGSGGVLRHAPEGLARRVLARVTGDHGGGWRVPESARGCVDTAYVLFAVGLLSSAIPYSLDFAVLRRISPRLYSIITALAPAIAVLAGWIVLGEALTPLQLVAVGVVCVAAATAIGTARRAQWIWNRSMRSVWRRRRLPSNSRTVSSADIVAVPIFVATTARSRFAPFSALPSRRSASPSP